MAAEHQMTPEEPTMWASPADHFKPRLKFLTVFTDYHYNQMRWLNLKDACLNKWYVPWWSPVPGLPLVHPAQPQPVPG